MKQKFIRLILLVVLLISSFTISHISVSGWVLLPFVSAVLAGYGLGLSFDSKD